MVRQAGNIYREVHSLEDIRGINRTIRSELGQIRDREELTELKKRSDYLCALTLSPSWRERFGSKSGRFLEVAKEENARTTKKANQVARGKGFDADYDPWGG
jgi:hypothetical protein